MKCSWIRVLWAGYRVVGHRFAPEGAPVPYAQDHDETQVCNIMSVPEPAAELPSKGWQTLPEQSAADQRAAYQKGGRTLELPGPAASTPTPVALQDSMETPYTPSEEVA